MPLSSRRRYFYSVDVPRSSHLFCACAESNLILKPGCNQRLTCVKKNGELSLEKVFRVTIYNL